MDEMSKNMSFEYPEKPKFREQETGHVYFDTDDAAGGSVTYTYADGTVEGHGGNGNSYKKINDFLTKDRLIGCILTLRNPSNPSETASTVVDDSNVIDAANDMKAAGYAGDHAYAFPTPGGSSYFISIDSPFVVNDNNLSFPEAGLYILNNVELTFPAEAPEPFSKNVTIKAHTEYTSHANGKIGEGGGTNELNALIISTEGTIPNLSTDKERSQ